jgi:colicin import membrane protein
MQELKTERERVAREQEAERKRAEQERRKAEEKRKTEEAAKAERERRAEEARKAEEARAAGEARAAEQARKEAERKRIEQELQSEIEAEEAAARAAADESEINRYIAAIRNRVHQSFTIVPGFDGLSCTLRITLIPGGEVSNVEIVKSSGNPAFDRQAENAVRKAAPLPVPTDPRLFRQLRSIAFVFEP